MERPPYYVPAHDWESTEGLPPGWACCPGWRFVKRFGLRNPTSVARPHEPVEVEVELYAGQVTDAVRELRVAQVPADGGPATEIPSQAHLMPSDEGLVGARLFFLAHLAPEAESVYLLFYGNPEAPQPEYDTDLSVTGDGWSLTLDNPYYCAVLAPSMGQLKSIYFKVPPAVSHEAPAALVGVGPPMDGGHGVEGTIHWGPDWSDENAGRYRLTNWAAPPNHEVLRGPVGLRLRRWGHPILALGAGVGRDHKVTVTVTYTFFASTPWILMESRFDVLEDVRFRDCRNDEWVGMIPALPEAAWMTRDGTIGFGPGRWRGEDPAWMTYYNVATGEGFASLHLEQECTHPAWSQPDIVSMQPSSMRVRTRGAWVRYPLRHATMRAGDFVRERNAYLVHRYKGGRHSGFGMLMDYHERLTRPAEQVTLLPAPKPLTADHVLDALRASYDHELYIEGTLFGQRLCSVVDLGLVRRVDVDGGDVHIDMVMPYDGRETWFDWFASSAEARIRERVAGVGSVDVRLVREPAWSPSEMNDRARRLLAL